MSHQLKQQSLKYTGAFLGLLTYVALLYSPLSGRIDLFIHGYYEYLGLVTEEVVGLWKWLLVIAGVVVIPGVCAIFLASLKRWQKWILITGVVVVVVAWSPVLVVWGIIWSPVLLALATLWSILCSWMIQMFLPQEGEMRPPNQDLYMVDDSLPEGVEVEGVEFVDPHSMTHP